MSAKYSYFRWAVNINKLTPSLAQLTTACASIQPEEKTRLIKFHYIDDFLSSLVGRLLMRKFVSEATTIPYIEVKFDRDVRGKPYLKNPNPNTPQISFNVSHQGGMIVLAGVVAVASNQQLEALSDFGVGIDVMKVEYTGGKPLSEFFRLMNRTFSDFEWRFINRTHRTEKDKLKAFIRHWCLKESYVKTIGVGIMMDLQKASFTIHSDNLTKDNAVTSTTLCVEGIHAPSWHFEEQMLDEDYCVAIAFNNCKPHEVEAFKFITFDELLVDVSSGVSQELEEYCRSVLQKERKQNIS